MLLRHPHDLAGLFREGRRRRDWSQTELARRVGASRQWVSAVENGKTSIEFDLATAALQALGYGIYVSGEPPVVRGGLGSWHEPPRTQATVGRTALTRDGAPLSLRRASREHG